MENFRREKGKQIKNTCTSVTGIVDEVELTSPHITNEV